MQNRKKQYLLAAIGLVIMVALLVGSSYAALFNYENVSVGDMNIQTDDKFEVEGEQEVTIQNLVPTTYEEMEDNKLTMTFVILGHNNMQEGKNYAVYLVKGDNLNPIDDRVIYAQITYPSVTPGYAINYFGLNDE